MPSASSPAWIEKSHRWLIWPGVVLLLCLGAGFLVYGPALGGDLIWDDFYLVRENPFFRSPVFGLEVFRHYLFFDSFSTYYRPVQNWSYMLDYWVWHGSAFGYHFTNVVLHSLSGFLLYLLLRRLLPGLLLSGGASATTPAATAPERDRTALLALLVALLWVVHPVHNAAVAYISGRADSLAALFAMGAWLCAIPAMEARSWGKRLLLGGIAAALLLVGLCSKEIALMWLILVLGHLFVFDREHTRRAKLSMLAGVLCVLGAYAVLHSLPAHRVPMEGGPASAWSERVLLMLRALGDYASLLVYPGKLYMERALTLPVMYRSVASWQTHVRFEYLSTIGLLVLLATICLCRWAAPGRRLRIFGAAWFGVAFLPISNLFPLNAQVAEHWIYLASMGALLFAAGVVLGLPPRGRRIGTALAVVALGAFGVRTAIRAGDWINAETFCARTIEAGGATPRILSSLSSVYSQRGEYQKQEVILRKMIAQFPDYALARMSLGICLARQGRTAEAEPLLGAARADSEEVSRQYPRTWPAVLQLAQVRRKAGQMDEALTIVREARTRFPEIWELAKAESDLLRDAGGPVAALAPVESFAAAHWWHIDAQMNLGLLRYAAGRADEAIAAFQEATRLDILDTRGFTGIAEVELSRGRAEAALEAQFSALERDPDQPRHYAALAQILEKLGRKNEANAALQKARLLTLQAARGS